MWTGNPSGFLHLIQSENKFSQLPFKTVSISKLPVLNTENEILDIEQAEERSRAAAICFGVAIALFVYWFVADLMHWPHGGYALIFGMFILLVVMVLRFLKYRQTGIYQYFYFGGKVSWLVGIYAYIMHFPISTWFVWSAFGFFGVGLLVLSLNRK